MPDRIGKRTLTAALAARQPSSTAPTPGRRTLVEQLPARPPRGGAGPSTAPSASGHGAPADRDATADQAAGPGADPGADLYSRVAAQIARVKQKVGSEMAHYEEVSRAIASEHLAGRLPLGEAELQQFDQLNAELDEVTRLFHEPPRAGDVAEAHRGVEMLKAMTAAKRTGEDVLDAHAGTVLPLVRDVDTLNYLVQNRLERLALGFNAESNNALRFAASHESGAGVSDSLPPTYRTMMATLRAQIDQARAETKVEASMLTLLGAALLAEVQARSETAGNRLRSVFSSRSATRRRAEKSADKRKQEIQDRFGDFYELSVPDGQLDMSLKQEAVGSVTIPELENHMDATLAANKPKYMARAVRAAVDAHPDFERTDHRGQSGRVREGVVLSADAFQRLSISDDAASGMIAPRQRLLHAGLTADRNIKLNDLKFSLTRDARAAIDAEHAKSNRWLNPTRELTREKVALLVRTVDVIVLCDSVEEIRQAIAEAQRQHDALWREWKQSGGGETAEVLERWADAAARFAT